MEKKAVLHSCRNAFMQTHKKVLMKHTYILVHTLRNSSEFHMSAIGFVLHHQCFLFQTFHFIWCCGSSYQILADLAVRTKRGCGSGVIMSAAMFPDFFWKDNKFDLQNKEIEKYNII